MRNAAGVRDRSRRGELQALLGDRGTVLPHQWRGTPERPARGWYAELEDRTVMFLGDDTLLAAIAIANADEASR
jgi:hypothetical protein